MYCQIIKIGLQTTFFCIPVLMPLFSLITKLNNGSAYNLFHQCRRFYHFFMFFKLICFRLKFSNYTGEGKGIWFQWLQYRVTLVPRCQFQSLLHVSNHCLEGECGSCKFLYSIPRLTIKSFYFETLMVEVCYMFVVLSHLATMLLF